VGAYRTVAVEVKEASHSLEDRENVTVANDAANLPIERVISQQDVRLYRAQVFLLESTPTHSFSGAHVEYLNPLPVYDSTGRLIGGATIVQRALDGSVRVDLVFDYAVPERLDIETDQPVYAHPRGLFYFTSHPQPLSPYDGNDFDQRSRVSVVKLKGITLSNRKSSFGGNQIVPAPA
jgi:hypothetical protein